MATMGFNNIYYDDSRIDILVRRVTRLENRIEELETELKKREYHKPSFLDFHFIKEDENKGLNDRVAREHIDRLRASMLRFSQIKR